MRHCHSERSEESVSIDVADPSSLRSSRMTEMGVHQDNGNIVILNGVKNLFAHFSTIPQSTNRLRITRT